MSCDKVQHWNGGFIKASLVFTGGTEQWPWKQGNPLDDFLQHARCAALSIAPGIYQLSKWIKGAASLWTVWLTNLKTHQPEGAMKILIDMSLKVVIGLASEVNSLWPSDVIWRHRSRLTLVQVMACCLTAPSHYLTQCGMILQLYHIPIQLMFQNMMSNGLNINCEEYHQASIS